MKLFEEGYMPEEMMKKAHCDKVYINDVYQVNLKEIDGGITWLSIKRRDKDSIHDWRDMQLIKNMICGEEREGCEIYPAESRLVDTSNQYHIFVLPKGQIFPFGYGDRLIVTDSDEEMNTRQRPFKQDELPNDAISSAEMRDKVKEYMSK